MTNPATNPDTLLAIGRAYGIQFSGSASDFDALDHNDYYIDGYSAKDGVPYWDSMALNSHKLGDYTKKDADPFNAHEPVDSSAAAIAAQGFLRLGTYLTAKGEKAAGKKYFQAGLTIANTLFP